MLYIKWVSGRLQDKANITLIANEVEAFYTNVNGDGNLVHTVQCNHTLEKIIGQIRSGAPDSRILLISPIWLGENVWKPGFDPEFSEKSVDVSKHLAKVYRQIAEKENIAFLNAAAYAKPSAADQEHMDPENHRLLAEAIYQKVIEIDGILE